MDIPHIHANNAAWWNENAPIAVKPSIEMRDAFLQALDDYDKNDPTNGEFYSLARRDFSTFILGMEQEEKGLNLPVGYVPCSHRWLVHDGVVVGIFRVRHNISTPRLANEDGHIGYDVPPSQRGKGYGIACLKAAIDEARRLGLSKILVCCDAGNPPSWRTIEHCGGILEVERFSEVYQATVRRYWIDISAGEQSRSLKVIKS